MKDFNYTVGQTLDDGYPIESVLTKKTGTVPSLRKVGDFSISALNDFTKKYKSKLIHEFYEQGNLCSVVYKLDEKILLRIYKKYRDESQYTVSIFYDLSKLKEALKLENTLLLIKNSTIKKSGLISILCFDGSFYLKDKSVDYVDVDIEKNYNNDFIKVDTDLQYKINNSNKGLFLLHGEAGTGKTSYIRYLISVLKKRVIYIPPNVIDSITDPNFISFFMDNTDCVLVIEDAENILMKRASGQSQGTSNLLNLTDGLLSDFLNIQVIATFNTDLLNIDTALLRKGRLQLKYKFTELSEDKVENLSKHLGVNLSGKMKLCDIYNSTENSYHEKKEVGFKVNNF